MTNWTQVLWGAGIGLLVGTMATVGSVHAATSGDEPLRYAAGEGVALAWIGEELAIATPEGIRLANLESGAAVPFFAPSGGVLPLLAATPGFLGGVTKGGEVVVWDLASRREIGRRPGGAGLASAAASPVLALAPGGMQFLVGDGGAELFQASLDSPLPLPVGYPGPGKVASLGFDASGALRVLPSRWSWSRTSGAWTPGTELDFRDGGGRNRLAWAPGADLLAVFRHERPTILVLDSGVPVDLGFREAMDLALDPAGDLLLVSFQGARGEPGYGSGELSDEPRLGSLESYDPKTGARQAVLVPAGAADHRTMDIGLAMAALGEGRFATVDLVEHEGEPSLYLRLRGRDLVATAELALDAGQWPVHLAAGGGLLAVCYEEQQVDVFDASDLTAESTPAVSLPIDAQSDPTAVGTLPGRDVFAMTRDGNILAMCGPTGAIYFANPRTGWPNEIVSVNLARGAGRPLDARFDAAGNLTLVTQDPSEGGAPGGLFERTLDASFTRWSDPVAVGAVGALASDGRLRVELRHGEPGNLDVYAGAVTEGKLLGHLVARRAIGPEPLDALAISEDGSIAWARAGLVQHAKLERAAEREAGPGGAEHGPR